MRKKANQNLPGDCTAWEAEKIMYIFKALRQRLNLDLWGEAETGVNPNSGYSWVWSEDYPVSFYMPINCDLQESDVWVLWSNPENGDEQEAQLTDFNSVEDIYDWVKEQEEEAGL